MRAPSLVLFAGLTFGLCAQPSIAGETSARQADASAQDIAPEAREAVAVVDAFSDAIKVVRIDDAAALLDPQVLVLESGGSERNRDHYLAEHAQADANYMRDARQELRYRQARIVGDIAWVGTESVITRDKDGKPSSSLSTETMLLKKTAQGWKIVHIHWSSRPAPAGN
jgi:ketosteroid isomerase-like protein